MANFPEIASGKKDGWKLENTIDIAIKGAIVGLVVWQWGSIVPFLLKMVEDTVYLVGGVLVLGAVAYMAFDSRVRNLLRATYDIGVRKLTGFIVERDPIGIMKNYIDRLVNRKEEMLTQMTKLKGQKRKLKDEIDSIKANAEMDMRRASKANEVNNRTAATVSANKVGRAKSSLDQLMPLYSKMEKLETFLNKMYESIGFMIEDISDEVANRERLYNIIKASHSAIKSAAAVMGGDKDERAMFEMATEAVKDDVANRVGYMEQFITESTNFINGVDIDNQIYEDKGLDLIEQFDQKGMDWLTAPVAQAVALPVGAKGVVNIAPVGQPSFGATSSSIFDN